MKKKKKKASNNRLMFFGVISALIIAAFLFNFIRYTLEVKHLEDEQVRIENELYNLKQEEDNLKNEIVKLKNPDYLARYARESYMYSKDGEYIIKVKEEKNEIKNDNKNTTNPYLIAIIVTVLLTGTVITKKIFF